jgi:nicotinate-nucleotide adenylyltransferase
LVSADDSCSGERLGIIGGTFDPIHIGHLILAEEARLNLQLDRVVFVPAGHPWRKASRKITPGSDRMAMASLAIASNPFFSLSSSELERVGPTFTVDTLQGLRERLGAATHLWFIMGSDALIDLKHWREPGKIVALARLAIGDRSAGNPTRADEELENLEQAVPGARERIDLVPMPQVDISSSDLRRRLGEGSSCRYLMPETVEHYATAHGLYTPTPKPAR